jgi:hypothetical protein
MKVNEYIPNLDVAAPVWLDALEHLCRPWQMAYFRPFSNVISIKTSRAAREKNTSNMADVRRWRHRVTSLQVLYIHLDFRTPLFLLAYNSMQRDIVILPLARWENAYGTFSHIVPDKSSRLKCK